MIDTRVEPLIDLGDMHLVPPEPEQPARPRAVVWRAVAVAAVAFVGLGGATVPVPPLTATAVHSYGIASSFAVAGDRMYATRSVTSFASPADWTVTAVSLPDGRELWRSPYDVPGGRIVQVDDVGDVTLVVGGDNGGQVRRTVAYAAADGRLLWTVDDEVQPLGDGRTGVMHGAGDGRVRAVDLRTGGTLWTVALPGRVSVEPMKRGDGRLVVLSGAGRVELRDARDGAVVRAATPLDAGQSPIAAIPVGDAVVLWFVGSAGTGIVALEPETLTVRWRRTHPVEGGGFGECAGLVCVSGDAGVDALDPADGTVAWHTTPARYVVDLGGHLVVLDETGGGIGAVRTVDPASGATVTELSGWRTGSRGGPPVLAFTPPGTASTVLAVLGPTSGLLRRLGGVPGVALSCQRGPTAVVCRMTTGELRIWRLGRPG